MASYDDDKPKTLGEKIGFPGAKSGAEIAQDDQAKKMDAMKRRMASMDKPTG
jgi:hypothetical protein